MTLLKVAVLGEGAVESTSGSSTPVLPVSEWPYWQSWAARLGMQLRPVSRADFTLPQPGVEAANPPDAGSHRLVAWPSSGLPVARRWASVLGRTDVTTADSFDELAGTGPDGSLTLVVPPGQATVSWLLDAAHFSVRTQTPVGVLRSDRRAVRRHVLLGAVARSAAVVGYTHFADSMPGFEPRQGSFLGPQQAEEFLSRAAEEHHAVLLQTYSNGSDSPIGQAILCARDARRMHRGHRALPCFSGGPCLRSPDPGGPGPRYVAPEAIHADAVLFDGCWAVMPDDGLFSPAVTLAGVFLTDGWARAVLGPICVKGGNPRRFMIAAEGYLAGQSLGQVALQLNSVAAGNGELACWALFGDPLTNRPTPSGV